MLSNEKRSKQVYPAAVFFMVKHLKKQAEPETLDSPSVNKNRKCSLLYLIEALRWHFHAIM